jgi:hypothetical protein
MGRLYRQCLNDRLPADKMTRLVMVLREIRNGLLQEAMMAQGTGQNGARTINNIQIIAVPPTGHVIGQNGQLLQIDHDPLCIEPS